MANEKFVLRSIPVFLNGYRISIAARNLGLPKKRDRVDSETFEDLGADTVKGSHGNEATISGVGSAAETELLTELKDLDTQFSLLALRDGDMRRAAGGSPVAVSASGDRVVMMRTKIYELTLPHEKKALRSFEAGLGGGGSMVHYGKLLWTNLGTTAYNAAGGPFLSPILNMGAVVAGKLLAWTPQLADPPGFSGTSVLFELLHDSDPAMATPIVGASVTLLGPGGSWQQLDGDVAALTGELFWRERITVTGAGTAVTASGIDLIDKSIL